MNSSHHDSLMKSELVKASFWQLIRVRMPWLLVGLVGALMASFIVSNFENSLRENIALAFFIPVVAYMSDTIGNQTEIILIRALTDLKFNIFSYVVREIFVGALMGFLIGFVSALFAYLISRSLEISLVVGLALFISMSIATLVACGTPILLRSLKKDPAVASGPFSTALQDMVSLSVYFLVATLILH
jgi:magnesium transporter